MLPHKQQNDDKPSGVGSNNGSSDRGGGADAIDVGVNGDDVADLTLETINGCGVNDDDGDGGDMHERGNWTGRFDFLLSLLGYSVGLGNVWRFPYLCYNNGGGAFLIPFTVMLVIAGLPLMFMELSFGQYAALGPIAVYQRFCPLFKGLGVGMILVSAVVMLYYNVIIAWTIHYMFASLRAQLPWQTCDAAWSTICEYFVCVVIAVYCFLMRKLRTHKTLH